MLGGAYGKRIPADEKEHEGFGELRAPERAAVMAQFRPYAMQTWDATALGSRVMKKPTIFRWHYAESASLHLRWSRSTSREDRYGHDGPVGKMRSHEDTITLKCGDEEKTLIDASPYEGSGALRATMFRELTLLVEWVEKPWVAGHGHMGSRQDAVWVDLNDFCIIDG